MARYKHNWAEVDTEVFKPAPVAPDGQDQAPEMPGVELVITHDGAGAPRGRAYMCGSGALAEGVQPGDLILKNVASGEYRCMKPELFKTTYTAVAPEAPAPAAEKPAVAPEKKDWN